MSSIQSAAAICEHWLRISIACGSLEIRRIEIILAGNPDQRKKRVPSCVGEWGPHATRGGNFTDRANRPVGGNHSRRVRQHRGEIDEASGLINRRGLHGGNFVLGQHFAANARCYGCRASMCASPTVPFT